MGDPDLEDAEIRAAGGADPHPGRQVEQPGTNSDRLATPVCGRRAGGRGHTILF